MHHLEVKGGAGSC